MNFLSFTVGRKKFRSSQQLEISLAFHNFEFKRRFHPFLGLINRILLFEWSRFFFIMISKVQTIFHHVISSALAYVFLFFLHGVLSA